MTIKYRELMKEWGVDLNTPEIDPVFKSKAEDFEAKLAGNELTDEEIAALDAELVELFTSSHKLEEVESEEVKLAKHKAAIAEAKAAIAEAASLEALNQLRATYEESLPEILPLVDKKIAALDEEQAEKEKLALKELFDYAEAEIAACPYNELQAMGEKYKTYPELVAIIRKRHEDEKPKEDSKERAEKLLSKKQWGYAELRAMGITPTGNDMTIDGVRLEKEYLLNVYSVRK